MSITGGKGLQMTIAFGMLALGGVTGWLWPLSLNSLDWVQVIFTSAPLLWIPLAAVAGRPLVSVPLRLLRFFFPAALLLAFAFLLPPTQAAGLCTFPWLLLSLWLTFRAVVVLFQKSEYSLPRICGTAAYLFLLIGAVWATADRLGIQFFGFDPVIGLLTAVHFHFAGFLLLLVTGLALLRWRSPLAPLVGWMAVLGPPLVAVGILITHFEGPPVAELIAATVMALGGVGSAVCHFQLAWQGKGQGACWMTGAVFLLGGMMLALLYGWRSVLPIPLLSIPWMYAVHGSINAGAMALLVVGWLNASADGHRAGMA
ncbi:MAG: YndJ family transporter [Phaeodactylibacter sp.]|nr:YndJ family transporter [Phaeodactylibacter sp.]